MYERRQSYRMEAVSGFDRIVLKHRSEEFVVRLRDTSETGLSVICATAIDVRKGDEVKIRTEAGWFSATVAHASVTPQGQVLGLARCPEPAETSVVRKAQAWGTALAFVGIILAVPLLRLAWNHYQSVAAAPAKPAPAANPARAPDRAAGFGPVH